MNPNKVFLVQKGEIEGRVDPNFVSISKILEGKLQHSSFRIMNFGKCISYIQYGISKLANTEQKGIPIIRMNNLKGDEWDFSDIKHIELLETEAEKYKILNGDLLFNRTNSKELVGKCGVFRYPGNWVFASYLIRVRVNESLILPNFASFFLSSTIGRLQIDCLSRQIIGMTNINAEEIKLIKIPVPPLEIQAQIVAKFEAAYAQKRAKEAEAKKLLAGIDEYLLNALGIRLPEPTEKKKFFYMRANQISGGRFDPDYFDVTFSRLRGAIHSGNYPIETLSKICEFISNGKTPAKNEYSDEVTPYPIIKVASYSGDTIDLDKVDYANNPRTCFVKEGDIFVLAAAHQPNYVGRFVKQLNENPTINTSFVGELICLRAQQLSVKSGYLFALLSTKIIKTLLNCEKRGQTSHIYPGDIRKILIPLPPLAVQTEIAEYIRMIRAQAKQLEQEAKEIIERAKQEVEAMILGS